MVRISIKDAVLGIAASIILICGMHSEVLAQQAQTKTGTTPSTTTLYSILKHQGEQRDFCLSFRDGPLGWGRGDCDLQYGGLYMGVYRDWFESPLATDNRSRIKDLGPHAWSEDLKLPVIKPLAKLKPGQSRVFRLDTSAASFPASASGDASDPGTEDLRTRNPNVTRSSRPMRDFGEVVVPAPRAVAPRPGEKVLRQTVIEGPRLVKAVAGHLYLMHVVNDTKDFYALFRVEVLNQGDRCTISWKLIPAPVSK